VPENSQKFALVSFESDVQLAKAVANKWLGALNAGNSARCLVALSGGRIAQKFFAELKLAASSNSAVLQPVHFFWGDERCVSPDDPESNFAIADSLLFRPLQVQPGNVHRIKGELPPEESASLAEAELLKYAKVNSQSQPIFDLIFLGMGEDGHVASLFPEEPMHAIDLPDIYRAVVATKPPPRRVTLGYQAIAAAKDVWVLASGPGKAKALRESLLPDAITPLARVINLRRHTNIFSDIKE
jgi:6-phosphogluconolactonase